MQVSTLSQYYLSLIITKYGNVNTASMWPTVLISVVTSCSSVKSSVDWIAGVSHESPAVSSSTESDDLVLPLSAAQLTAGSQSVFLLAPRRLMPAHIRCLISSTVSMDPAIVHYHVQTEGQVYKCSTVYGKINRLFSDIRFIFKDHCYVFHKIFSHLPPQAHEL